MAADWENGREVDQNDAVSSRVRQKRGAAGPIYGTWATGHSARVRAGSVMVATRAFRVGSRGAGAEADGSWSWGSAVAVKRERGRGDLWAVFFSCQTDADSRQQTGTRQGDTEGRGSSNTAGSRGWESADDRKNGDCTCHGTLRVCGSLESRREVVTSGGNGLRLAGRRVGQH